MESLYSLLNNVSEDKAVLPFSVFSLLEPTE